MQVFCIRFDVQTSMPANKQKKTKQKKNEIKKKTNEDDKRVINNAFDLMAKVEPSGRC